jgi:2-succinyl-5-enolpyruvyl-6-hydroxy-3-cyclohexene-1-carboxylate synthase
MTGAATTLWARSFVDELARQGVREVALSPGSRSTPLVMALAGDDRFRVRVHLDERSAAFFALGVGKASGRPAVVVTTSGTAAVNVFPAVVEASAAAVPLLVLTADRPHHLRDADANQAIDQVHLYGRYVRRFFEAAPPVMDGPALRHLRTLAGRAVAAAVGPTAGAVHVNFPFDKPLEPSPPPGDFLAEHPLAAHGRPDGAPFVRISTGRRGADPGQVDALVGALDSPAGVIVAGPGSEPARTGPAVLELAARTGFPVLADPLSGARYGPALGAQRVSAYDLFLDEPGAADRLRPSVIVRVGASPTSATTQRWLARHNGVDHIVIDGESRWKDHGATATLYINADAASTLAAASARLSVSATADWRNAWAAAEAAALAALAADEGSAHEGDVLAAVGAAAPAGSTLFVSNSMPVRDLDSFAHPREEPWEVLGNRGASGIDGIVSTAFGIASQRDEPIVCVIGDLAFFHDQNGLLWTREGDARVVFVLVDNDGGGIFHMLPIAGHEPHFTRYFATPHGLDLRGAADMHGIDFRDTAIAGLAAELSGALSEACTVVLRVRTDRDSGHARRGELRDAVRRAVAHALRDR